MTICHKCKQQKEESQIRVYHLALSKNVRQNSFLAGLDRINLCYSCDGARKTSIVRFLEGS